MKGSIKNYFYALKSSMVTLTCMMIMFSAMGFVISTGYTETMSQLFTMMFAVSIPASLPSLDSRYGWSTYANTMAIGRQDLISARYISELLFTAFSFTLLSVVNITCTLQGDASPDLWLKTITLLGISLIIIAFQNIFLSFDESKAQITQSIFLCLWTLAILVFCIANGIDNISLQIPSISPTLSVTVLAASIVALSVSVPISTKAYSRVEL